MAEGFAKKFAPKEAAVYSAGTSPVSEVHPLAIEVMREFEIDISEQTPKSIADYYSLFFDIGVVLDRNVRQESTFLPGLPPVVSWDVDDPAAIQGTNEEIKLEFRSCAIKIRTEISTLFGSGYYKAIADRHRDFISLLKQFL